MLILIMAQVDERRQQQQQKLTEKEEKKLNTKPVFLSMNSIYFELHNESFALSVFAAISDNTLHTLTHTTTTKTKKN